MYFVFKIVLTYFEKKSSIDQEKLLKFETEGREFSKILRSQEQIFQIVTEGSEQLLKQNVFLTCFFNLLLEVSQFLIHWKNSNLNWRK